MAKNKFEHTEENLANIEEAISKTERFVEKNKNYLSYGIIGIFAVVLLIMGYNKYIRIPNEEEAFNTIWHAEEYFNQDSIDLALNGSGEYPGFLEIIDDYGSTKSGNLARYYAGICYFKIAQKDSTETAKEYYQNAIDYLEDFDSDDLNVKPMSIGVMGDCQMELGNTEKAVELYLKGAHMNDNEFISPMLLKKAGMTYALLGNHQKALETYNEIKNKYLRSQEYYEIKKYIAREEAILAK
jgi:tetratricopeptide (TPR) repeat protein